MALFSSSPLNKKKTKKSITWHDSDAPDAKGKFKELSPKALAAWLIKTRKGNLAKILKINEYAIFPAAPVIHIFLIFIYFSGPF